MKQKVVMKVPMNEPKTRSKAMKLVAGCHGVLSIEIAGDDKSQIVVVGEQVDSVELTRLLRKRLSRFTELVSVSDADKDEDKKEVKEEEAKPAVYIPSMPYIYEVREPQSGCCMM